MSKKYMFLICGNVSENDNSNMTQTFVNVNDPDKIGNLWVMIWLYVMIISTSFIIF